MKIDRVARALTHLASSRLAEHVSGDAGVRFARDPVVCGSGRYVAWLGSRPQGPAGTFDVYLTDRVTDSTRLLSQGFDGSPSDGGSDSLSISADGRYLAFSSAATNLVPDDDNGCRDVFLFDREQNQLQRISAERADEPSLSGDGRWLAYQSPEGMVLRDLESGQTEKVADAGAEDADLSFDGQVMAWSQDAGVVRWERSSGRREVIQPGDWAADPQLSEDGSTLAFRARGGLYVHHQGDTRSVALDEKGRPLDQVGSFALSGDGRTVAYETEERRLVLQRDLGGDEVEVVNREHTSGRRDWGESVHPALNHDGSSLVMATSCRNLGAQQVRVDSGFEPYRIFAIDNDNVALAFQRADGTEVDIEVQYHEDAVQIGDVYLPAAEL